MMNYLMMNHLTMMNHQMKILMNYLRNRILHLNMNLRCLIVKDCYSCCLMMKICYSCPMKNCFLICCVKVQSSFVRYLKGRTCSKEW